MLDINPDISTQFVRQGWGFQALYDAGMGDLNYHRLQGMAVGRKDFSRAFIVAVVQAGMTLGDSVPPQQLYEVGGAVVFRVSSTSNTPATEGSWRAFDSRCPFPSLRCRAR